jgi:hypothetical protein
MELIYGGRRDELPPHKDGKDGTPARRMGEAYAFWVVLEGGAWGSPLTVFSPGGKEAIALFSGEEEARMFCHLRAEEGANATIRRTTAGAGCSRSCTAPGRPSAWPSIPSPGPWAGGSWGC